MHIAPTVGRVVWYYRQSTQVQPNAALVAAVNEDRTINVGGFDRDGDPFKGLAVPLVQEGDAAPLHGHFCRWMPYQVGQARAQAAQADNPTAGGRS